MLTGFASLGVLLYWLKGQESIVVLLVASDGLMEASADSDEDVWRHRNLIKVVWLLANSPHFHQTVSTFPP